jgi:hypothetical protein
MRSVLCALLILAVPCGPGVLSYATETQRVVKAGDGVVRVSGGSSEAAAFIPIENGTMYDVYLVNA